MGEYDSSIALAKRRIKKKGQQVTLRSLTATAAPDPAKPWYPGANVPVNWTVDAVFLGYEQKYIDGEQVQMGDQQVYMPAADILGAQINPEEEGLVIRGTETWKIIKVKPLNPAGDPVMYELQVRQ